MSGSSAYRWPVLCGQTDGGLVSGCAKSGRFKTSPASRRPTDCSLTPTAMMSDSFRSMQLGAILLMGVRR